MEKFNYTGHKKLWNWLADNPGKNKHDYFEENKIKCTQYNYCYACQYTTNFNSLNLKDCKYCPVKWDFKHFFDDRELYLIWEDLFKKEYYDQSCKIARRIANLPVREGVEYE